MAVRLLMVMLLMAARLELPGCGPFLPRALFALSHAPERPAEEFARGKLGVLLPGYTRNYLIVAYRYMEGAGLSDAEREKLFPGARVSTEGGSKTPEAMWLEARNKVPGVKRLDYIDPSKTVQSPNRFEMYVNCNDDAFRTATATMGRIAKQHGPESAEVKEWVAAQDQVFTNCSGGPSIPAATADPDRAYQVAAAKFYAGQLDEARAEFRAIAQDSASPWHEIAPYVAARCLIRKGAWPEAEQDLKDLAENPEWREPAARLLAYVAARRDPKTRLRDLAGAVMRRDSATLAQDVYDYHFLLDRLEADAPVDDDITDWILTFQAGGAGHAIEKWRATRSVAWLAAALTKSAPGEAAVAELMAAAREVKPDSSAYATIALHRARLSPAADARRIAEEALRAALPLSARNLFRAERMRLADNFDEFLRHAGRTPVGEETDTEESKPSKVDRLDADAASVFNQQIPLAMLKRAAESAVLPEIARRDLRNVIFVREVVLRDRPSPDQVYRLLKTPGLKPFVDAGLGRSTEALDKIDNLRDNWWCAAGDTANPWFYGYKARMEFTPDLTLLYGNARPEAAFLAEAERAQAAKEWSRLKTLPAGPNWLSAQVLEWARRTPDDPRLPEALHLAVRTTRYGCTDKASQDYSKRAFELLHRRFPASEWAKKTPYWFRADQ